MCSQHTLQNILNFESSMFSASTWPSISNGALPTVDCPVDSVDCEEFTCCTIPMCSSKTCLAVSDAAFTRRFNSLLSRVSPLFLAIELICLEVTIWPFLKLAKQVLMDALSTIAPFLDALEFD